MLIAQSLKSAFPSQMMKKSWSAASAVSHNNHLHESQRRALPDRLRHGLRGTYYLACRFHPTGKRAGKTDLSSLAALAYAEHDDALLALPVDKPPEHRLGYRRVAIRSVRRQGFRMTAQISFFRGPFRGTSGPCPFKQIESASLRHLVITMKPSCFRVRAFWPLIAFAILPPLSPGLGAAAEKPVAAHAATFRDDPFFAQLKNSLGRGINLGNALEAPKEGDWGVTLKAEYFARIKAAGFHNVRIPVRWSAHAARETPYTIEEKFLARVDWAVRQALQNQLAPVLNMHHYDELCKDPEGHRRRFLALWQQIAEHYRAFPPELVFELLNEPNGRLDAAHWNPLLADALGVVRRSNPRRQVVVGPTTWNSIGDLDRLQLPESDRHLIVTVHYYNPFQFTHQGASWVGSQSQNWQGTRWTGKPAERQAVANDFDKAIAWAVAHRRPIYLGEFGAYSRADMESRARWTRFVADAALERKMGFAYWEFCSGFGVYDPKSDTWIKPIEQALVGGGTQATSSP
jgi:endoglucanase